MKSLGVQGFGVVWASLWLPRRLMDFVAYGV